MIILAVKILKEEPIIDGWFDLNLKRDKDKYKKSIDSAIKFTNGELKDYLYDPNQPDPKI